MFESYKEMAVPLLNNDNLRVFVNTDDHDHEPHFHVQLGQYNNDKWKVEMESRIMLLEASYFTDDEKRGRFIDTRLPQSVLHNIDSFLRQPQKQYPYSFQCSNWQLAIRDWNRSYGNTQIKSDDIPKQQPDYTSLETSEAVQKDQKYKDQAV